MFLTRLVLDSFRNYKKLELDFEPEANKILITGDNGQGKTNLLESVYMLSVAKSFRTTKIADLILWNSEFTRIKGDFVVKRKNDEEKTNLEVFLSLPKRATKKNDVIVPGNDFMGTLNVVLFHPQDMNLLLLSPDLRRKYLDLLASQTDKKYLSALIQYRRVLKNRNNLLGMIQAGRAKDDESFFWDQELVKNGGVLLRKRKEVIEYLNKILTDIYRSISGGNEEVEVKYQSFVGDSDPDEFDLIYSTKLLEKKHSDVKYGYTSVGPHRDDLKFYLDGKEVDHHGSRGECRTLLISLKLAEISFIEQETSEKPILLLDDVFSELDASRQEKLLESIDSCQTFITGTSDGGFAGMEGVRKIRVENGDTK